jgi:hypothetical protein
MLTGNMVELKREARPTLVYNRYVKSLGLCSTHRSETTTSGSFNHCTGNVNHDIWREIV